MIDFSDLVAGFLSLTPERKLQFLRAIGKTYEGHFYKFDGKEKIAYLQSGQKNFWEASILDAELAEHHKITANVKKLTVVSLEI